MTAQNVGVKGSDDWPKLQLDEWQEALDKLQSIVDEHEQVGHQKDQHCRQTPRGQGNIVDLGKGLKKVKVIDMIVF